MPRDISQDFRNQVYSTQMQSVPLVIMDITHSSISPTVIHVVNNTQDIIFESNTYTAVAFKYTPPEEEGSSVADARVSICNIDRQFMELLRTIKGPPSVTARVVLVGETIEQEAGPYMFSMSNVTYDVNTITCSLTYDFKVKQILSSVKISVSDFPGLAS